MRPESDLARALDPTRILCEGIGAPADTWQAKVLRRRTRRCLQLVTRQGGKSTTTAAKALHKALYTPGSLTLLVAPSQRQSGELFSKVVSLYRACEPPVDTRKVSAMRMELDNGSRIIALPGSEKTIRGYSGVDLLVIDEAARVLDELYYSVRPMLAVSDGELIAMTTPWGKRGWFYDEWTDTEATEWTRIKVTADACPRITETFLEEERRKLGAWWFRQEYFCEFSDTVDSLFSTDDIDGAFSDDVAPLFAEEEAEPEAPSVSDHITPLSL